MPTNVCLLSRIDSKHHLIYIWGSSVSTEALTECEIQPKAGTIIGSALSLSCSAGHRHAEFKPKKNVIASISLYPFISLELPGNGVSLFSFQGPHPWTTASYQTFI